MDKNETGSGSPEGSPAHRTPRLEISADIEFIGDFDIVRARGVNLSGGGICFEISECLPFEMRFEANGEKHTHRARLVWLKRLEDGACRFGFEFEPSGRHTES